MSEQSPAQREPINPNRLSLYATAFGLALVALALLWTAVLWKRPIDWFPREHWALDLALGAITGTLYALIAWTLAHTIDTFRRLKDLLIQSLDMNALRPAHALLFGLIAGVPEEILFRGALQPVLGWIITSLIFGVLHSITPTYFIYASAAGALFSGLTIWRGGLWAPIAAHAAIDTIMFLLLIRDWHRRPPQM